MSAYQDQKLKEEAMKEETTRSYGEANQCAGKYDLPSRVSIRDRLERRLEISKTEERKLRNLCELKDLLTKYPDIARILDLIESLQV